MSSEKLGSAKDLLKGNLAGSWDILEGCAGNYADLGIALSLGGASAAYSLRNVGSDGLPVVRVRRDSDDAEDNFSANQIVSGALEAFVGSGNDGFVEIWFDQSGNSRHLIQETATNQPKIVSSGSLVTVNGKPAISFDGSDNFLEVSGSSSDVSDEVAYSFSPSGDFGIFFVTKNVGGTSGNLIDSRDAGGDGIFVQQRSTASIRFKYNGESNLDVSAALNTQHFASLILNGTTLSASVDGGTAQTTTVTAGVDTTQNLVIGAGFNNLNFIDAEVQELIFYENSQSSNKSEIEANINNFYSIN
tara:strand:- start:332 stop:1240 length:909 start_codon:yes stop_codon:yes gene_type:complete